MTELVSPSGFAQNLQRQHITRQARLPIVRAAAARVLRPRTRHVLYGPAVFENPYQTLLYSGFSGHVSATGTHRAPLYRQLGLADVYHLHWDDFGLRAATEGRPIWQNALTDFKARGGRLVWTVHNAAPHEGIEADAMTIFHAGRETLCKMADLIHVHSTAAAEIIMNRYGAPADRILVLPHPSYAGWYSDTPPPVRPEGQARFLAFGTFRNNKGLSLIVDAFQCASLEGPIGGLHVAGRGADQIDSDLVTQCAIQITPGFVPDDTVADLFEAAHFAVFGFSEILTSGSLLLALTFGTIPIVPDFPQLREVLTGDLQEFLFQPGSADDLARVIVKATELSQQERASLSAAAAAQAETHHPLCVSEALEAAIAEL